MPESKQPRYGRVVRRNNGRHSTPKAGPQPAWNQYLVADARTTAAILGGRQVLDVTITSPPYWDVKNYGGAKQIGYGQSLDKYLDDLVAVFTDVWRCTKLGGSLWVVMKSVKKKKKMHLLPFLLSQRLTGRAEQAWHLQDVLVWNKTHTLPWSHPQKLTDSYEHILCFSKSKEFTLNLDALRSPEGISNWWVKYPERYHPHGKTLSNVWEIAIPTQGSWGNGHFAHACPLPAELVRRIILLASGDDGVVFDPFAGTGSTPLAATALGRRWLALDINREYRKMFERRLAHESAGGNGRLTTRGSRLAATNLSLRQLKYALTVFRRVAPGLRLTAADAPLLVVLGGRAERAPRPYWVTGLKVTVVLSDACYRTRAAAVREAIREACGKPPLSKFQLEVTVDVGGRSRFFSRGALASCGKLYLYTRGEFWRTAGETERAALMTLEPLSKLPRIVSDLRVVEEPAF